MNASWPDTIDELLAATGTADHAPEDRPVTRIFYNGMEIGTVQDPVSLCVELDRALAESGQPTYTTDEDVIQGITGIHINYPMSDEETRQARRAFEVHFPCELNPEELDLLRRLQLDDKEDGPEQSAQDEQDCGNG
jgi:hypothetical protein